MEGLKIDSKYDEFKFLFFSSHGTHQKWLLVILWLFNISNMTYGKHFDSMRKQDMQFILFSFPQNKIFIKLMNLFTSLSVYENMKYASMEIDGKMCRGLYTNHNTVCCGDYGKVTETLCIAFAVLTVILFIIRLAFIQ